MNTMAGINFALENFRYNVIIAVFHEIYSYFNKLTQDDLNYSNLKENYKKILIVMMPIIPHQISECWEKFYGQDEMNWPSVDKKFIDSNNCNIVIQINGKKRSIINCKKGITEESLIKKIKEDAKVNKFLQNKNNIKSIFIKDKLLNLIIKG